MSEYQIDYVLLSRHQAQHIPQGVNRVAGSLLQGKIRQGIAFANADFLICSTAEMRLWPASLARECQFCRPTGETRRSSTMRQRLIISLGIREQTTVVKYGMRLS
jgi:hypothetical protein